MADAFFYRTNGLFYDVVNARTGEVVEELIDCVAEARNYVEEHTALAREAEAAEDAQTEAEVYRAVRVILRALDGIGRPADMRRAA